MAPSEKSKHQQCSAMDECPGTQGHTLTKVARSCDHRCIHLPAVESQMGSRIVRTHQSSQLQPFFAGQTRSLSSSTTHLNNSSPTETVAFPNGFHGLRHQGFPRPRHWDHRFISDVLLCLERLLKPKAGPRAPSVHYCEVGRVSCTGLQTYWDHLEGQKCL